jgi:predicted DNA-binding antitoxin AbrB/MazE fold protein
MSQFIQAIYEHGVFRPLEPVQIAEHKQVSLVVTETGVASDKPDTVAIGADVERQRDALAELRAKMDALPARAAEDGLGGADHDLILYGWRK